MSGPVYQSGGGLVNHYGLGAAQLPLTVMVDTVPASGGYLMAAAAEMPAAAIVDVDGEVALWLDLREAPELSVVKTLRPVELDVAVRAYLDPRTRVSHFTGNSLSSNQED